MCVIGWGSTYGPIGAGVRRVRAHGLDIAQVHLRHLNPFPKNLGAILASYDKVLVPEMNLGQLSLLLRSRYLVDAEAHNSVSGMPFGAEELENVFLEALHQLAPDDVPAEISVDLQESLS
jgi:2-oxoglutarate ferredoxin oxidoreductase subunit alpha